MLTNTQTNLLWLVKLLNPYGLCREKTCLWGFANNKGADQPVHPHSLMSGFVIRLLESIISRLVTNEISSFYVVSVAEQAGLNLTLSETRRQVFSRRGPYKLSILFMGQWETVQTWVRHHLMWNLIRIFTVLLTECSIKI